MIKSNKRKSTKHCSNSNSKLLPLTSSDHKGITLVALIITVIVMLILLGVTLNIALNGGLFGMTKEAVKKTEIAAYKEKIDAVRINIIVEQISKGLTSEKFMERYEEELRKDKNFEGSEITREGETIILITKEGYKFEIKEEGTNYEGDTNAPETPKNPPSLNKNNTNITYTPSTWTNGKVTVEISTTEEGYTLQYKTTKADGTIIEDWRDYTAAVEMSTNGSIDARLIDDKGKVGGTLTGNVTKIDTEAPEINTHLSANATNVVGEVELSIEVTDSLSGLSTIKWHYTSSGGTDEIVLDIYTEMNGANAGETEKVAKTKKITGLTPGETYSMYAEVYDVAGKSTRSPETGTVKVTTLQYPLYNPELLDGNGVLTANATYIDDDEKRAVVPKGFKVVPGIGGTTSIKDGLVIQDKDGNEFVWIPVKVTEGDKETEIKSFYRSSWTENGRETMYTTYKEPYAAGYTEEEAEYNAMLKSVYKNGGFYIGRYEAGSTTKREANTANGTTTMVVKQGVFPYNNVGWGASMTNYTGKVEYNGKDQGKGAVLLSKEMYQTKNVGVVSTLCYGIQWDTMLDFIRDDEHSVINSSNWGNYKPIEGSGSLADTGSSNTYSAKNIYDVAGNVAEWTMEEHVGLNQNTQETEEKRVYRGGNFMSDSSDSRRAAYRNYYWANYCTEAVGFRPALYIN